VSPALPAELLELVYLRVSQINGCAYCIDMHTRDLLKQGVKSTRWRWCRCGTKRPPCSATGTRRAGLGRKRHPRRADQSAGRRLPASPVGAGRTELADLTVAVALMNAFNRFGVSMRMQPAALAA
jgi:AhpD family alkylhydroperoxidase